MSNIPSQVAQVQTPQAVETILQSRWGFHICDRETFLKIKTLHKRYWQNLHLYANWLRWDRKQPQNRVIRTYKRDEQGRRCGVASTTPRPEPRWCPLFGGSDEIVQLYQQARMPQTAPPAPLTPSLVSRINSLHETIEAWFTSHIG